MKQVFLHDSEPSLKLSTKLKLKKIKPNIKKIDISILLK